MNKLDKNVLCFSPLNERVGSKVLRWIRLLGFFVTTDDHAKNEGL